MKPINIDLELLYSFVVPIANSENWRAINERVREMRFARMLEMVFPLLERLEERDFKVSVLLEPKWFFVTGQGWLVETKKPTVTYVFTSEDTVWSLEGVGEK
jgi:hypothetical protein